MNELVFEALYQSMIEAEKEAVRCRLAFARQAESPFEAAEILDELMLKNFQISISETPQGWFLMELPVLLPKKKEDKSLASKYISPAIFAAVERHFNGRDKPRLSDCVVCIISVYGCDTAIKQRRDHDNLEISRLLNCLTATGVLAGDNPADCDLHYTFETGKTDATKVLIRPRFDVFSV